VKCTSGWPQVLVSTLAVPKLETEEGTEGSERDQNHILMNVGVRSIAYL